VTGDPPGADLQNKVVRAMAAHPEIVQVHGFYYSEEDRIVSVDVVPDITVRDDAALVRQLTEEIQALAPGLQVVVVIDHNYSE
jgi:hypothetical protein